MPIDVLFCHALVTYECRGTQLTWQDLCKYYWYFNDIRVLVMSIPNLICASKANDVKEITVYLFQVVSPYGFCNPVS